MTFNNDAWETEFLRRTGYPFKKAMELIKHRDVSFHEEFEMRTGFPFEHANMRAESWTMWKWPKRELFDVLNPLKFGEHGNFMEKLERLQQEVYEKPGSTIKPLEIRAPLWNILLLVGLTASAQRDTHENLDSGVSHIGVGTDGTAESQSQTGLIAAYGSRKAFDTTGQRKVVSQTSKYNMLFSDADLTVPVTLKEGALYNAVTSGTGHARIQYPDFALAAGQVITFQINELMANG